MFVTCFRDLKKGFTQYMRCEDIRNRYEELEVLRDAGAQNPQSVPTLVSASASTKAGGIAG